MTSNAFWSEAIDKEMMNQFKWRSQYQADAPNNQYHMEYQDEDQLKSYKMKANESNKTVPEAWTSLDGNFQSRDPHFIPGRPDPQAPRMRIQSKRRERIDWPHLSRPPQMQYSPMYCDYLHRREHLQTGSVAKAEHPRMWSARKDVAYNRNYNTIAHVNELGSRNLEHKFNVPNKHHPHPATDSMSTRYNAFPATCPVHAYMPQSNW
eukprot:CAMPEP_0196591706 /NCGR_PEP_ID=MMETSP1081-20130531/70637_1 /TAXON_ID=36882 /ORGANISM="Pyramimonas amylifera, Strain CCMP720" /LENGTH=206 /DNA_ID=CAMNT_0041915153 /DNA_START=71 /DNA_END=688 /DNA_ORIENTATION=+